MFKPHNLLSTLFKVVIFILALALPAYVFAATLLFPQGGGTGTASIPTLGQVLVGQSNGTYQPQATSTLGITGGGGSTSPGGLNLQVQYNNAGAFGGISGAVTNGTILNLTNPLLGGATLTTSSVNGVTLTTGGGTTTFLNANGAYSTPVGTTYAAGTGLTLTTGAFNVNVSQNITTLSNLTVAGFVQTTSGGVLSSAALTSGQVTTALGFTPANFAYPFPSNATSTLLTLSGGATIANSLTLSGITGSTQCLHVNSSGVISGTGTDCGSSGGSVTGVTATYPILSSGGTAPVISTAFGTTTANTYSALNIFNGGLTIGSLTGTINANSGVTYATATSSLSVGSPITVTGTLGALIGGTNSTINCQTASGSQAGCLSAADWTTFNNKTSNTGTVTSVSGSGGTTGLTLTGGAITTSGTLTLGGTLVVANGGTGAGTLTGCVTGNGTGAFTASGTCNTSSATVSSVGLSSSGTLTIGSSPITTSGILTADINLANPNTFTALQQFNGNASTTAFTISSNLWLTALGTPAGAFLAVDPNGNVIATTTPSGSGAVSSVSNSDGSLTISPTTASVVASVNLAHSNAFTSSQSIQSTSATAFSVGANGATNPALAIDGSTASSVTGIAIKSAATGGQTTITATDSGANSQLGISSKGNGQFTLTAPSGNMVFNQNSTSVLQVGGGDFLFQQGVSASGAHYTFSGVADTALTTTANTPWFKFNGAASRTHASGAIAEDDQVLISPTPESMSAGTAAASIITNAATLTISGTPFIANAAPRGLIVNAYDLYLQGPSDSNFTAASTTNKYGLRSDGTNPSFAGQVGYSAVFMGSPNSSGVDWGNVGIGTTTPAAKLYIQNSEAGVSPGACFVGGACALFTAASSTNAAGTTANTAFTVLNSGNVGIGTSTPTAAFASVAASTTIGTVETGYVGQVSIIAGLENGVTKLFEDIDQWGHLITSGDAPTVTGGTSSVSGNDRNGTVTVTGTALTSVTLNFAHPWLSTPECTVATNSTASVADISSISTTAVTFGFSVGLSSNSLYYICASHQ